MHYLDLINFALVVTILLNMTLGVIILVYSHSRLNTAYLLVVMGVVFWTMAIFFYRAAPIDMSLLWCKILYVSAALIPSAFLYFVCLFSGNHCKLPTFVGFVIPTIAMSAFTLFSNAIIEQVTVVPGNEKQIIFGPWYTVYVLYISLYFGIAFYYLFKERRVAHGVRKIQFYYIFWGCFLASAIALMTNLFLPWIGYFQLNWLGQVASLCMTTCTVYAIIKHRLFDFQMRTQQFLNILIPIIGAGFLTTLIRYGLSFNGDINTTIGILILAIYTILYELLRRWLNRSQFSYMLFQRTRQYQQALQKLAKDSSTILDLDLLTHNIIFTLIDEMRVAKAAILITTSDDQSVFEVLSQSQYMPQHLKPLYKPSQLVIDALTTTGVSYIRDELELELEQDIPPTQHRQIEAVQKMLAESETTFILGLRVQHVLMGFIVLGNKLNNKSYSVEDVTVLEDISNTLAVALMNSKLHKEKTALATLLQDEVKHAVDAWKLKSKENQELSAIRSQFLSIASHQLRTPISVVRNSMQLILEDYFQVPEQGDFVMQRDKMKHVLLLLNNAYLASENLKNTTESILAASELIGSVPSLRIQQIETSSFFQRRMRRAQSILNAKAENQIQFHVEIADDLPKQIVSDENKLGMVIDNIFSNAVLYTLKGSITIRVYVEKAILYIQVIDTGIGIPEDQQSKIFQRFIRLDNAQRIVPDGSGLGLYLAKEYIELLRGEITFTSQEGKGSTFTISIPLEYRYIAN